MTQIGVLRMKECSASEASFLILFYSSSPPSLHVQLRWNMEACIYLKGAFLAICIDLLSAFMPIYISNVLFCLHTFAEGFFACIHLQRRFLPIYICKGLACLYKFAKGLSAYIDLQRACLPIQRAFLPMYFYICKGLFACIHFQMAFLPICTLTHFLAPCCVCLIVA